MSERLPLTPEQESAIRQYGASFDAEAIVVGGFSDWIRRLLAEIDRLRAQLAASVEHEANLTLQVDELWKDQHRERQLAQKYREVLQRIVDHTTPFAVHGCHEIAAEVLKEGE